MKQNKTFMYKVEHNPINKYNSTSYKLHIYGNNPLIAEPIEGPINVKYNIIEPEVFNINKNIMLDIVNNLMKQESIKFKDLHSFKNLHSIKEFAAMIKAIRYSDMEILEEYEIFPIVKISDSVHFYKINDYSFIRIGNKMANTDFVKEDLDSIYEIKKIVYKFKPQFMINKSGYFQPLEKTYSYNEMIDLLRDSNIFHIVEENGEVHDECIVTSLYVAEKTYSKIKDVVGTMPTEHAEKVTPYLYFIDNGEYKKFKTDDYDKKYLRFIMLNQ